MAEKQTAAPPEMETRVEELAAEIARLAALLEERNAAGDKTLKSVTDKAQEMVRSAQDAGQAATDRAREEFDRVEQFVSEHPLQAAAMAFLAGIAIGGFGRK